MSGPSEAEQFAANVGGWRENSRRATAVQQQRALRDPMSFKADGEHGWGSTARLGPAFRQQRAEGCPERQFYGYAALRHFRDAYPEALGLDQGPVALMIEPVGDAPGSATDG